MGACLGAVVSECQHDGTTGGPTTVSSSKQVSRGAQSSPATAIFTQHHLPDLPPPPSPRRCVVAEVVMEAPAPEPEEPVYVRELLPGVTAKGLGLCVQRVSSSEMD